MRAARSGGWTCLRSVGLGLALLALLPGDRAAAQGQLWAARHDSGLVNGEASPVALALDGAGNVYVTGTVGSSPGARVLTIKYAPDGTVLWRAFYGPARSIALALDTAGNAYVAAVAYFSGPGYEYRTIKYAATDGAELWSAADPAGHGEPARMAVDGAGNVFVTGTTGDAVSPDFLTVKHAGADGSLLWAVTWDGPSQGSDSPRGIALDPAGNAYVTGASGGFVRTIKYAAADGGVLWSAAYRPSAADSASPVGLALDGSGDVSVAGTAIIADPLPIGQHFEMRVIRYAGTDGSVHWVAAHGSLADQEQAYAMTVDGSGDVFVAGISGSSFEPLLRTVKFAGSSGGALWSASGGSGWPAAIAVDGAGNAHVAGSVTTPTTGYDYRTLKYAGPSGSVLWNQTYDGPGHWSDVAAALALDASGNAYVTGSSAVWTSGGYVKDFRTVKHAAGDGSLLFSVNEGATAGADDVAEDLAVDASGDVYVTGSSFNGLDWDMRTVKHGPDGSTLWSVAYAGPAAGDDRASAVAVDATGNAYVAGYSWNGTSYDVRTIKYAVSGAVLWSVGYDSPDHADDGAVGLALNATGDVYLTGWSVSWSTGRREYLTLKLAAADGSLLWSASQGEPGADSSYASAIAVDGSGDAYVTGTSTTGQNKNYLTVKYAAADGTVRWTAIYDNPVVNSKDEAYDIALDQSANAYVTGISSNLGTRDQARTIKYGTADGSVLWSVAQVDPSLSLRGDSLAVDGAGNAYVTGIATNNQTISLDRTTKYAAADGSALWSVSYAGPGGPFGYGRELALDGAGNAYVTGTGRTSVDAAGTYLTVKYGSENGAVVWAASYAPPALAGDGGAVAAAVRGQVVYVSGSWTSVASGSDFLTLAYDAAPPGNPTALASLTHAPAVWSNLAAIGMGWSGAADPPPSSGLAGYSVAFDASAGTTPDATVDVAQGTDPHGLASTALPDGQSYYFHLRACDHMGNCSAAVHAGPYWIDTTAPLQPASLTSSSHTPGVPSNETTLALQWTAASDPPSNGVASGIDGYGWQVDDAPGTPCSRVKAVEEGTTSVIMDMQSGTWYAHVCARDQAGNWSAVTTAGPYLIGDPADLSLTLVDDADPIHVNGTVTYTATYANAGPAPAPWTMLSVRLPPGLGLVSSVPGAPVCTASGALVRCALGELAPSAGGTVLLTAQAQRGTKGPRAVAAKLRAATSDPSLADNDATQATLVKFTKGDLQDDWATDLVLSKVTTGENVAWLMNGTTRSSEAPLDPAAPPHGTQRVSGVDDFDGDGRNDLAFWDSATGEVEFWLMNGATRLGAPVPLAGASPLPAAWRLSATADFDHDGWPDLLWRNADTQKLAIWTMNGTAKAGEIVPSPDQAVHANWGVVGAVDLNGDGNVDLLWYNEATGKIVYWWMDASVQRLTGNFTSPSSAGNANWKVLATGDYGVGPGGVADTADLVWRNATSGKYVVWYLDLAGNRTSGTFTSPDAPVDPTGWTIVGPR